MIITNSSFTRTPGLLKGKKCHSVNTWQGSLSVIVARAYYVLVDSANDMRQANGTRDERATNIERAVGARG